MPDRANAHPTICLNMIVRNEAHIVAEVLDATAPYISSWVIVDTGSDDGTQQLITDHMARLGIPGELHERPWRDFSHNRNEALALARGHADYIWVIDADDTVVGTPDFTHLDADICLLRLREGTQSFWSPQMFRDGLAVRYVGVVHERPVSDAPCAVARVAGEYHVESRRLGARNLDPRKYERDRDLLLTEVERNPDDARSVFFLAQSYRCLGDFANARKWYARRAEMGGLDEQVFYSLNEVAQSMAQLGAPWPEVQDAYLRAWEFRPSRAEPLYSIARRHREAQRYHLGYLFARHAAEIPFPEEDLIPVPADVYAWRAIDEQAVCATWIDKHAEAFALNRRLLARDDIPDHDRQRIAANRDVSVPTMLAAAASYPQALVQHLLTNHGESDVVVSLVAGPDRAAAEQTLNSFLHCCTDVSRVSRFLVSDGGLPEQDRALLLDRYGFLEFANSDAVRERFWLHLGRGWRFFAPESFIARLTAVLEAEPEVFQVAINFTDAAGLTGTCATDQQVHRAPGAGRYVLTDTVATGPAMVDTERRAIAAELRTATLDQVLCIATGC